MSEWTIAIIAPSLSIHWILISGSLRTCCSFRTLCSPLPIVSLSGVDRHDCLSPSFSFLCELWVELVLSPIAPHSVHPPQYGPSSRYLPPHLHWCYFLCNVRVFSPRHMAIPRKAFLSDICGDWLDHYIAPELFIYDSVFPCFALNPS